MNTVSIAELQTDVGNKLQAEAFFANINVVLLREKLFESEIEAAAIWQTVTNGVSGIGVAVHMPTVRVMDGGSPSPELILDQTISVLEEPNINQGPDGTGLFAEDVGVAVVQILHQFMLAQDVTLFADGTVMEPNREFPNIRGVDVRLQYRFTPPYNAKVSAPTFTWSGDQLTLASATAGAAIYYTTNGKFPSPANGTLYAAPVNVASGTFVRAAAYLAGTLGSDVWSGAAP